MIYTATKMKHQISQAAQTTEHVIILMVPLSKNLPLPPVQHYGLGIVIYISQIQVLEQYNIFRPGVDKLTTSTFYCYLAVNLSLYSLKTTKYEHTIVNETFPTIKAPESDTCIFICTHQFKLLFTQTR